MKALKSLIPKKPAKDEREKIVLVKLIDLYLETGKPVGSEALKEHGLNFLSSATLRNYFVKLEKAGYLRQEHTSGGRIPTPSGFKIYADLCRTQVRVSKEAKKLLEDNLLREEKEVASYLQQAAEMLSDLTGCAVFLSAPRFDQDFILKIKLVDIDQTRILGILLTDFGLVHTEILYTKKHLKEEELHEIEHFLSAKMTQSPLPVIRPDLETLSDGFYKEIMLRHIVDYTNFSTEDLYKTGFSKLLKYKDFQNPGALAECLAIFENEGELKNLLNQAIKSEASCVWIGSDLDSVQQNNVSCSIIATKYKINQNSVGAFALLGPLRIPYAELFGIVDLASDLITASLTKSLYKFKISYRNPSTTITSSPYQLLDDQT